MRGPLVNQNPLQHPFRHNGIIATHLAAALRSRAEAGLPVRAAQPLRATLPPGHNRAAVVQPNARSPLTHTPAVTARARPSFDCGPEAAEPHIRLPQPRLAPKSLIPEVIGLGRAGPIFITASFSQNVMRSAPPRSSEDQHSSWMASTLSVCVSHQVAFSIAPSGTSPWVT
jgi:hypothetical protein